MTDSMKKFYKALQAWVELDCPQSHPVFSPDSGICNNARRWIHHQQSLGDCSVETQFLVVELGKQLEARFGDTESTYPFNQDGSYYYEKAANNTWTNAARLAWIREHAA